MKRLALLTTALLLVLAVGALIFNRPAGSSAETRLITIQPGANFSHIAAQLREHDLIRSTPWFLLLAQLSGADRHVQPGEYELHAGLSPIEILDRLQDGQVHYHSVTIPEGYTLRQIADVLADHALVDRARFLALTHDRAFIHTLNLSADSLEGYLFPDTYFLAKFVPEEDVVKIFVRRFREAFSPELRARAEEIGMTVTEVLTLASVVEKETGLSKERALVAGVFHNRLRRNIPLQSDPTVIYALEHFDGDLRKRDLAVDSPYNTYRVRGLPPGPIANPGEASIRAVLYPTPSEYVYFVSKNDGSHQFSVTLAEHNRAVEKYQKQRAKRPS